MSDMFYGFKMSLTTNAIQNALDTVDALRTTFGASTKSKDVYDYLYYTLGLVKGYWEDHQWAIQNEASRDVFRHKETDTDE